MNRQINTGWKFILVMWMMFAVINKSAEAGIFDAWTYRMKITFSGYTKSGVLTNFPVLIVLRTNINCFAYTQFTSSVGADLRFASSNQTNELKYEVEKWDTNGISYIWVQVPRIASANDFIYAYWGKTGASSPSYTTNGAVWTNGYIGVWHMGEASYAQLKDSTTNRNHSLSNPFVSTTNGCIGNGMTASANYAVIPDAPSMAWTRITFEGWFKASNIMAEQGLISKGLEGYNEFISRVRNGDYTVFVDNDGNWPPVAGISAEGAQAGVWQYVVGVYDGANMHIYANGMRITGTAWSGAPLNSSGALYFGTYYDTTLKYTGNMDEIRISNLARSSNWVWACWINQKPDSSFIEYSRVVYKPRGTVFMIK